MVGDLFSAELALDTVEELKTLRNLANKSPLDSDIGLIQDLQIIIGSKTLTHYTPPTIKFAQKCHAKRLSFTFTCHPRVSPMDPESINELVALLPSLTELESLCINVAGLNANQAISIIRALPASVKALDLDYNMIGNYGNQNFAGFCKAIVDSKINSLTFGTTDFNDEEAKILAECLSTIQRPFEFIFHVGPRITPIGLQRYMDAMNKNPFLSISLSEDLHYTSNYNSNKPPSLFQLSLYNCLLSSPEKLPTLPPELTEQILNIQPQMDTWYKNFQLKKMLQPHIRQAQEKAFKKANPLHF